MIDSVSKARSGTVRTIGDMNSYTDVFNKNYDLYGECQVYKNPKYICKDTFCDSFEVSGVIEESK